MISIETYKFLHLVFIFTFFSLSTASFFLTEKSKKMAAAIGFVGFLILVAGMGLMAREGLMQTWPTWVICKLVLWFVLLGGSHSIAKRVRNPAKVGIVFLIVIGALAAFLAIFKSF